MPKFASPPASALTSERLSLRQLSPAWFDEVWEMVNFEPFNLLTATKQKFTEEQIQNWLETRSSQTNRCDWAILENESGEFAGEVVLNELDETKNSMNLRISLRNEAWVNRGIGTEAIAMVLTYAFDELGLEKVTLEHLVENLRANRTYAKLGFAAGRQFSEGKNRFQRMSITKLQFVEAMCIREMGRRLSHEWTFSFDSGKRRAGICNYTDKRISLSRYLVNLHKIDDSEQVLWHEIAHALCGKEEGHGKTWLHTAKSLGYRAEKFTGNLIAENTATWVGSCPAGHLHYRYRKPKTLLSCAKCSKSFTKKALISWQHKSELAATEN